MNVYREFTLLIESDVIECIQGCNNVTVLFTLSAKTGPDSNIDILVEFDSPATSIFLPY